MRASEKSKQKIAALNARLAELEAELAKMQALEAECAELRRALQAAKEELAALEAVYARLKAQGKASPEPFSRPHEIGDPAAAKKTDAAIFDKAVEAARQAYSKPLREVSPDTLPKRKLRICKNCGDEFDSRDKLDEFCCTQCRLEARQTGIE